MIIIGFGSNVGDRIANLKTALCTLRLIPGLSVEAVSPIYQSDAMLPPNAPDNWNQPYLNLAVRCHCTLSPHELLKHLKKCEWELGREILPKHWGPRIIDLDILAWDDLILNSPDLILPKVDLSKRPFALWPLADVAPFWLHPQIQQTAAQIVEKWGSRFSGQAPYHTKQINQRIDTPTLVGVLNVTPDSFSDGGKFTAVDAAIQQAVELINAGADVIDIGAESTSPVAQAITQAEEWQRLQPILATIRATKFTLKPKISLDTRHHATLAQALPYEIDWVNDVTGLTDTKMQALVAANNLDCVIMHHIKIPENRKHVLARAQDPIPLVLSWAEERIALLAAAGISAERIIFDPGIGFGKMAEQSFALISQIHLFKTLSVRLLVGHSRKTFLSLFTNSAFMERDLETTILSMHMANKSVDYLRIHNVDMCSRAMRVTRAIHPSENR